MADYTFTFWSRARKRKAEQSVPHRVRLNGLTYIRHILWRKKLNGVRQHWRALQNQRREERYIDAGAPAPKKPRRVNGRLRKLSSRLNERQKRNRRQRIRMRRERREREAANVE